MIGWREIPALVRHVTLAIHRKEGGGGADGFIRSVRKARGALERQGFLFPTSGDKIFEGIMLTGKGWERNLSHEMEGMDGDAKDLEFARMFEAFEPVIHELEMDEIHPEESQQEGKRDQLDREAQDFIRNEFDPEGRGPGDPDLT